MLITAALCALSLRAINSNHKPHFSEREIRLYHALFRSPSPRVPKSGARVVMIKTPAPSTVSLAAMSRYFESRCTPQDFLEAKSDRDFNCRMRRESKAVANA